MGHCDTGAGIIDLRHEQPDPPAPVRGKKKWKIGRDGKVVKRAPHTVTGIVIHQTACVFAVGPSALKKANGDSRLARNRRALDVACHVLAFQDGDVVHANPFEWYVWHGNGFNAFSLGLEIEGDYLGLGDGQVTPATTDAARRALKYMVEHGRSLGMPIEFIWAHRQSSPTRRRDPGQELWKKVVLEYAVPVLGLKTEPARKLDDGYTIPKEWDPSGTGKY